jgi:Cu2+-exporting ATPase
MSVKHGEALRAGSVVLGQPLTVRATALVQDSLVAEMARILEAGQQSRGRYVRWADRAAALYVPTVHGLALAVLVGGLIAGQGVGIALTNAIALLIITCPCALGLAVPAVQIVATSRLFRVGLLVKSGDALERLAEADMAVFDKTGTLTFGRPVLMNPGEIAASDLVLAASLARASKHPLSRALAVAAGPGGVSEGTQETPGQGLEAHVEGVVVRLGRAEWVGAAHAPNSNASHLWLRKGTQAPVRFDFEDRLRPDAAAAVVALRALGLNVEMLSGDRVAPAQLIAGQAGIAAWHAANDPKQKAEYMERLRLQGRRVLMIGDGLNDAAALALAHVSMSPATAAHASQSAADIVIQSETLAPIAEAVAAARAARRLVFQNFAFAAVYNAFAVPLAAFGQVTPLIAAVAMSASSLIVMLNALRLSRKG